MLGVFFCLWEIVEAFEQHVLNSVNILTFMLTTTLTRDNSMQRKPEIRHSLAQCTAVPYLEFGKCFLICGWKIILNVPLHVDKRCISKYELTLSLEHSHDLLKYC